MYITCMGTNNNGIPPSNITHQKLSIIHVPVSNNTCGVDDPKGTLYNKIVPPIHSIKRNDMSVPIA